MTNAYRTADALVFTQRLARIAATEKALTLELPRLRRIRDARIARIVAGTVGLVGAVVMIVLGILDSPATTYALLASAFGCVATYVLIRGLTRFFPLGLLLASRSLPRWTGHTASDLAALDTVDPLRAAERSLKRLELASVSLPLVALSLLTPLTLHFLVATFIGSGEPAGYSWWIRTSLWVVGLAHVTLVGLSLLYAKKLVQMPSEELGDINVTGEWAKAWGITIGAGCVPGIVFLLVPPLLTAMTGLVFIPIMFHWIHRALLEERTAFAFLEAACDTADVTAQACAG